VGTGTLARGRVGSGRARLQSGGTAAVDVLRFDLDSISIMTRIGWLLCMLGGLAACRDDGGSTAADTSGSDTGADDPEAGDDDLQDDDADDAADDDPSGDPTGPSTDPDDTGPSTGDDTTTDPDATGPSDESTTGEPIDPDALDDEFDDGLDGWSIFNEELSTIVVEAGELRMDPGQWTVWLDASTATLVHRPVTGDFKVTTAVRARSLTNPAMPPPSGYRFGGLMARDPAGAPENYVFIVLGTDEDPSVETKTTVNGASQYQGPPWPGAEGEVRICRVGDTFGMYVRNAGGAWQLSNSFERPDLPNALDVGPIAYNNDATPNVRATFQFVDFEPVDSQADCTE
jgi:hypothetical protein